MPLASRRPSAAAKRAKWKAAGRFCQRPATNTHRHSTYPAIRGPRAAGRNAGCRCARSSVARGPPSIGYVLVFTESAMHNSPAPTVRYYSNKSCQAIEAPISTLTKNQLVILKKPTLGGSTSRVCTWVRISEGEMRSRRQPPQPSSSKATATTQTHDRSRHDDELGVELCGAWLRSGERH
ncbi:hypothetical protein DFP72DRAFT_286477 [Ephemerocybe angulata]|uniref:Uncharacterized protein n=1 Tax=Ephemerocybe angulata TaxID=980116 RepID=A0A8H6I0M3_9AGAR|nr:hypothetical protein DFP72DRAFT_286477 [Tulosesus angulatus]